MAYWVQEKYKNSNRKSFVCDKKNDIDKLPKFGKSGEAQEGDTISSKPCKYGSDCFCIEDKSAWMLTKDDNTWKKISGGEE